MTLSLSPWASATSHVRALRQCDEAALKPANEVPYGLSSSINTRDLDKAMHFAGHSEVGLPHMNVHSAYKELRTASAASRNRISDCRRPIRRASSFSRTRKPLTSGSATSPSHP